jgi:hypothetical protein
MDVIKMDFTKNKVWREECRDREAFLSRPVNLAFGKDVDGLTFFPNRMGILVRGSRFGPERSDIGQPARRSCRRYAQPIRKQVPNLFYVGVAQRPGPGTRGFQPA